MPNRVFVCPNCGVTRRTSAIYINPRRETSAEAMASVRWPKHCDRPMRQLSFVQAEAVTQLKQEERVKWIAKGMWVLRQRERGNRKWKPVVADWQIEEAKRQQTAYWLGLQDYARWWINARRRRGRVPKRLRRSQIALGVEEK